MNPKYFDSVKKTRELFNTSAVSINDNFISAISQELRDFSWFNFKNTAQKESFVPEFISITQVGDEKPFDRKLRMLKQISRACIACSMCELGMKCARKNDVIRDPHVFSNMKPHRFMIVGQGPGWDELEAREPFMGASGKNLDCELQKHGMTRDDFYICNSVRCWIKGNNSPTQRHVDRCEPFLRMEINLIKPKLIITLGKVAFSQLCPDAIFNKSLKKLINSKYNIKVFPVYHPSPVNFLRKEDFKEQIKIMCGLVRAINNR